MAALIFFFNLLPPWSARGTSRIRIENLSSWTSWTSSLVISRPIFGVTFQTLSYFNFVSSWILKNLLQNLGFEEVGLIPMADGMVQCSTCGKTLSTMQSARRHYNLIHAKDTIDMATCPICQKQFSGTSYVDDHMRKTHKISKKMWKKSCGNLS